MSVAGTGTFMLQYSFYKLSIMLKPARNEDGAENFTNGWQIWHICAIGNSDDEVLLINDASHTWIKPNGHSNPVSLTNDAYIPEARWRMERLGGNQYRFRNVRDIDCILDLAGGMVGCGVRISAWPEHGGGNQKWIMKQKYV
ncbi:hypothetical protein PENVUL_c006G08498 [Penicillium vulpinum]|uniref:Uncharacterized protein n=1 Tax=Penicillium vulpinum TaxID=29845 RepID=A0A1V6S6B1_9EURO|nr:hypothetical protein PENVUL_c006G08498 [Penicillium vulpinum]